MTETKGATRHVACTLCEAMCGLEVTLAPDGAVAGIRGHEGDPLSRGHVCPKALVLPDLQDDPDRLRRPLVRGEDGELHEATVGRGVRPGRRAPRRRSRRPTATTPSPSTSATPTSTASAR